MGVRDAGDVNEERGCRFKFYKVLKQHIWAEGSPITLWKAVFIQTEARAELTDLIRTD